MHKSCKLGYFLRIEQNILVIYRLQKNLKIFSTIEKSDKSLKGLKVTKVGLKQYEIQWLAEFVRYGMGGKTSKIKTRKVILEPLSPITALFV